MNEAHVLIVYKYNYCTQYFGEGTYIATLLKLYAWGVAVHTTMHA